MATQLQIRRGTNSQVAAFTGAEGEIVVNTTNDSVHVNDGSTAGGFEMARADLNNVSDTSLNAALTGNTVSALTITTLTLGSTAITATGAELNILDGVTSTAAELNILDGVTSTTAELNILDGVTATTAELNYVDGVTSAIQTQIDTKAPLASPTFTGTVTAAALTVDGATTTNIDGSNYTFSGTNYDVHLLVGSSAGGVRLGQDSSTNSSVIGTTGTNDLEFVTYNGSAWGNRMTLSNSGNLGIGTTTPSRALATKSSSVTVANFESTSGAAGLVSFSDSNTTNDVTVRAGAVGDNLVLQAGGSERLRIDSSGNVGIGASTVDHKLHLEQSDTTVCFTKTENTAGNLLVGVNSSGNSFVSAQTSGKPLILETNNTERMRIDASGNLLVGCTALPSGGAGGAGFETGQSSARTILQLGTTTTSQETVQRFYNPNGNVGEIKLSGSSTSYVTSSDYRLKENVVAMSGATDRLKQLKPSRFNFIADADTTVDGFLAHEVQDVVPEAITGAKDAVDADGNPDYQGIDQSKLVPLLVATIQELEARLTALENN